ncbi:hypothetical protein GCM10020256_43480 [Streptomyces thermocoprophilus]
MAWPTITAGGEAELFEGGLGVVDVGLTGEGGLRGLLALAVAALVEGYGAVPFGEPSGGGRPVGCAAHQAVE